MEAIEQPRETDAVPAEVSRRDHGSSPGFPGAHEADAQPTSTDLAIADRRSEARQKGYVGYSCPDCGNFTFVRNGACLKCDTCGSTTGCS